MKSLLLTLSIVMLTLFMSGCYLIRQGISLMGHHLFARPVERVLVDPSASEKTREFLHTVEDILVFAQEELGLDASRNYTRYVEIDRSYLAAVVHAAEEFSFNRHTWSFPIVGEVPYKGFFNPEDARKEAGRLEGRGYDTWISAVTAFSTLGYFRDPLYSYMKSFSTYRLADLIIHELTHATLWVKDQAGFNEEIATFIGNRGAELYVLKHYGEDSDEYQEIFDIREDREQFTQDILKLKHTLEAVYQLEITDEEKQNKKELTISRFQEEFLDSYDASYRTERFRNFADHEINNAYVSIYTMYHTTDDIYDRLHEHTGRDLSRLVELLRPLDGKKTDPYRYMENLLEEQQ